MSFINNNIQAERIVSNTINTSISPLKKLENLKVNIAINYFLQHDLIK
jgi:hypothetical protein